MKTIWIIIRREYLTRVKKKTFIIMTILGPILMATLMVAPAMIAMMETAEKQTVAIYDPSSSFGQYLPETDMIEFQMLSSDEGKQFATYMGYMKLKSDGKLDEQSGQNNAAQFKKMKEDFFNKYDAVLHIPENLINTNSIELFSENQPPLSVQMHITNAIQKDMINYKIKERGIDLKTFGEISEIVDKTKVSMLINGASDTLPKIISVFCGFVIYFFIFLFGTQVLRGVIEEKTSRIIEVIISSVRPFHLMMGKIIGIALVGLTQFALWVILTFALYSVAAATLEPELTFTSPGDQVESIMGSGGGQQITSTMGDFEVNEVVGDKAEMIFASVNRINFPLIILTFLFEFLFGYLLYAALFAAIGSAVDSEADTQQFMLPVTIPLILSMMLLPSVMNDPNGTIAQVFSLIPFTSPIVMMMRIPFGVSPMTFALSAVLLIGTWLLLVWFAGRIYRTGILMYGKKITYRELFRWLRYKSY